MSTVKATNIQEPNSATVNITLGTSGEVTLAKSPVLNGSTSGTLTIAAPAVAGTNTQTLVAATGTLAPLISGTAQASTSGTSRDFTDIPSWVKRITVMFSGVSTNGTSNLLIQLGTSSGVTATGYLSYSCRFGSSSVAGGANFTTGFGIAGNLASNVFSGATIISSLSGNTWVANGFYGESVGAIGVPVGGGISLAATLDRVRITTVGGTDTFDAGTINIMYE